MGQQQLLILLVVTIIVGLATILAVSVIHRNAMNTNRDAVRQDVFTIAAEAQGWYIKPQVLKGGGYSFKGVTFQNIGFGYDSLVSTTDVINGNGEYQMQVSDSMITVKAIPSQDRSNVMVAEIKKAALTFVNQTSGTSQGTTQNTTQSSGQTKWSDGNRD